jgi:hypothetical protein
MLDHVIVMNERHLHRLLRDYVDYYNADRVHTRLRDSPIGRPTEHRPSSETQIVGLPRVTRKLRFLPFIIGTSGKKQLDRAAHLLRKQDRTSLDE